MLAAHACVRTAQPGTRPGGRNGSRPRLYLGLVGMAPMHGRAACELPAAFAAFYEARFRPVQIPA